MWNQKWSEKQLEWMHLCLQVTENICVVDYFSNNKVIGKLHLPLLKMQVKIWEIKKYQLGNWEIWELIRTNAFVVAGQWAPQWMQIASIHSTQH